MTWDDVGALKDVREELTMAILVTCNIGNSIGPMSMLGFLYTVSLFSPPVVGWEVKFQQRYKPRSALTKLKCFERGQSFFLQIINFLPFSFDSGASEIPRGISIVWPYTSPGDTVGRASRVRQNSPGKGDYLFAHFSF